jgi:hypothetical protein
MRKLSAERRKILRKLAARPSRNIDLSDIPEIQEIPSDAVIGKFYRMNKETIAIKVDLKEKPSFGVKRMRPNGQ